MRAEPGLNVSGTLTRSGAIHAGRLAMAWSMSAVVKPISVA